MAELLKAFLQEFYFSDHVSKDHGSDFRLRIVEVHSPTRFVVDKIDQTGKPFERVRVKVEWNKEQIRLGLFQIRLTIKNYPKRIIRARVDKIKKRFSLINILKRRKKK